MVGSCGRYTNRGILVEPQEETRNNRESTRRLAMRANHKVFLFGPSPLSRIAFIPAHKAARRTTETLPRAFGLEFRSTMAADRLAHLRVNFVLDHSARPQRMRCNGSLFRTLHLQSHLMVVRPSLDTKIVKFFKPSIRSGPFHGVCYPRVGWTT